MKEQHNSHRRGLPRAEPDKYQVMLKPIHLAVFVIAGATTIFEIERGHAPQLVGLEVILCC